MVFHLHTREAYYDLCIHTSHLWIGVNEICSEALNIAEISSDPAVNTVLFFVLVLVKIVFYSGLSF